MGKVILGTTMSVDGFINDRIGSVAALYPDLAELPDTGPLKESIQYTGAVEELISSHFGIRTKIGCDDR